MKQQARGRPYFLRNYDRPVVSNPFPEQRKMSVHYKFKAALDFSTVTFDGIHISVSELKKAIIDQKRLGKNADFDLQIINAQTKEVYSDENALIPKNTSVIVARVPITDKKKSGPPMQKENAGGRGMHHHKSAFHQQSGAEVAKGSDLSSMDMSEEDKIKAMMTQSTADYDPSHYVRIRGANQHGRVPDNYRCNKCNQGGHWIKHCPNVPTSQPDVKKSTGIPRSFMVVVDSPDFPGALMTPEGRYAVPAVDHAAYLEKSKGQQTVEQPAKPKIPDDLVCTLCNDLLTDALLVPCCANSYCDDCIRSYLLESDHECPGCHEKDISPTSLIPNRFLRGTVNAFKNETGYSKPEKVTERAQKPSPKREPEKEEPRKLSLDELPDDLFPHSPKKIDAENDGGGGGATDPDSTKDLYDFNDGSIPSPFASPKRTELKDSAPVEQRAIQSVTRSFPGGHHPHGGMMRGGPPPQHQHVPPPPHHMSRKPPMPSGNSGSSMEPPPPGFDVPPPGEDSSLRSPNDRGQREPGSNVGHDNGHRDNRGLPPGMPPQQQGPPMPMPPGGPPPSFNPMQPPPGYPGGPPPSHGGHPGGMPPGIPPPGFGPPHGPGPNMGPNNFGRMPHPMNRGPPPMQHGGPPPRYPMDHEDFRGRGRRPYPGGRMDDLQDENRPGVIDDPLKEFERLMREKDRRKKLAAAGGPRKRSKSRSFSPSPRRTSPFPPKRSRSRSFSRSPSPKRKRPLPSSKRRRSYSRSPSRSPPMLRRVGKSRSRSRNRSMSPTPPGKVRRSARRAPPQYSPSPPPSRFNRKEKDEYFDSRGRDRYDDRPMGRFPNKPYSSRDGRDYDSNYDGPSLNKYDIPSPAKHDSHKYDPQRRHMPPYHGHVGGGGAPSHEPPSSHSFRDKPPLLDSNKRPYDFEPNIAPPGTESATSVVPSLMDINVSHHQSSTNVYPISTIGAGAQASSRGSHHRSESNLRTEASSEQEKGGRGESRREDGHELSHNTLTSAGSASERKKSEDRDHAEGDRERKKKSPVGKKHKKEKKKHKKKSKEEKDKRGARERKKSKDEKSGEGEKSSDEETEGGGEHQGTVPLDPVSVEDLIIGNKPTAGQNSGATLPIDLNIGVAKQTAPCDSTVKSPDRAHETTLDSSVASGMIKNEESLSGGENPEVGMDVLTARRGSLPSLQNLGNVPEPKTIETQALPSQELHLPPSKWDEYEDYSGGNLEPQKHIPNYEIPGVNLGPPKREPVERTVTSEVLKRAEQAIFDKPLKVTDDLGRVISPPGGYAEAGIIDPIRKYDKGFRDDPPLQSVVVQQVKPDLKPVNFPLSRKSAKDRLGSKVSEDDVVLNKAIESSVSVKSKVSAVRDSGSSDRRRRSRSRSPAYSSSGRFRNRSRSRSIDRLRNRSRHSVERQQKQAGNLERDLSRRSPPPQRKSPPAMRRDRRRSISRERRRSPSRERDSRRSMSRERRRSLSRERRSLSKSSRDRDRGRRSPSRERKRSTSRGRQQRPDSRDKGNERRRSKEMMERDRRRSNSRNRGRSRSRDRRRSRERRRSGSRPRRSRSPVRRRSPSRDRNGRRRSPSRDRKDNRDSGRRERPRSPFKRPVESSSNREKDSRDFRERDPKSREPTEKIRLNLLEEKREPNIPSLSRPGDHSSSSLSAQKPEEPPSPEARVFQQSSDGHSLRSDQVFSPTLKKQKGRINIKLSSISKTEVQQSGSSSSDDEHDPQDNSNADGKNSPESGDEKKKKKRRHSSISTKSSSSSDVKRKKKKKEKKKKKKKKKSK